MLTRFDAAYDAWLDDCLMEWNERYLDSRISRGGPDRAGNPPDVEPWELVEFAENGSAYPHGIGGVGHVVNAVTPWRDSPHWREK